MKMKTYFKKYGTPKLVDIYIDYNNVYCGTLRNMPDIFKHKPLHRYSPYNPLSCAFLFTTKQFRCKEWDKMLTLMAHYRLLYEDSSLYDN